MGEDGATGVGMQVEVEHIDFDVDGAVVVVEDDFGGESGDLFGIFFGDPETPAFDGRVLEGKLVRLREGGELNFD